MVSARRCANGEVDRETDVLLERRYGRRLRRDDRVIGFREVK